MKSARTIALGLSIILMMTASTPLLFAQAAHVRWDIVSINFATGTVSPGDLPDVLYQSDRESIARGRPGDLASPSGSSFACV